MTTTRDTLHPCSLPGGVREAWASLSCTAQTLGVFAGEADDPEDNAEAVAAARWGMLRSPPP